MFVDRGAGTILGAVLFQYLIALPFPLQNPWRSDHQPCALSAARHTLYGAGFVRVARMKAAIADGGSWRHAMRVYVPLLAPASWAGPVHLRASFRESRPQSSFTRRYELFALTLFDLWREDCSASLGARHCHDLLPQHHCGSRPAFQVQSVGAKMTEGYQTNDGESRHGARMIMGLFIGYGRGPRGWDDRACAATTRWRQPEVYQDLALVCGAALRRDGVCRRARHPGGVSRLGHLDRWARGRSRGDPLIAVIAAKAEKIGLASTLSTTLYPPSPGADSTLDHLTRGRVGWNVVTSSNQSRPKFWPGPCRSTTTLRHRRGIHGPVLPAVVRDPDALVAA